MGIGNNGSSDQVFNKFDMKSWLNLCYAQPRPQKKINFDCKVGRPGRIISWWFISVAGHLFLQNLTLHVGHRKTLIAKHNGLLLAAWFKRQLHLTLHFLFIVPRPQKRSTEVIKNFSKHPLCFVKKKKFLKVKTWKTTKTWKPGQIQPGKRKLPQIL